jgi:hypothetical protein
VFAITEWSVVVDEFLLQSTTRAHGLVTWLRDTVVRSHSKWGHICPDEPQLSIANFRGKKYIGPEII